MDAGLSTALTGLTIHVYQSYLGSIGTILAGVYTYLVIDGGTIFVGENTGATTVPTGSGQILVDFGSTAAVANILNTSSSSVLTTIPPVCLKGSSLTINGTGGSFGAAVEPGSTTTLTALNMTDGPAFLPPTAYLGIGVTTTAMTAGAGTITDFSSNTRTTATITGQATLVIYGTGATTTASVGTGAIVRHFGSGNVTTLNNSGTFDRTGGTSTITVANYNIYAGSSNLLNNGKASSTIRTTVTLQNCSMQDFALTLPLNEKL